jgi:hypothetical protein
MIIAGLLLITATVCFAAALYQLILHNRAVMQEKLRHELAQELIDEESNQKVFENN